MEHEAYSDQLVTLVDDEGQEHEFNIVDVLEHNEDQYVALVPVFSDPEDQLQDDGELVILKRVMDEGEDGQEEFLEAIEDEAEFDEVAAIFMERLEDQFDFTYEDEDELEDEDEDGLPS